MRIAMPISSALSAIEVATDDLEYIATSRMGVVHDAAGESAAKLKSSGASAPAGAFSSVPEAEQFERQQQAVHQVFIETVDGMIQDLRDFQANLKACLDAHKSTDEGVGASLLALGKEYHGHTYRSVTDNAAARQTEGTRLKGLDGKVGDGSTPTGTGTTESSAYQ